jgi:hypothetical protein
VAGVHPANRKRTAIRRKIEVLSQCGRVVVNIAGSSRSAGAAALSTTRPRVCFWLGRKEELATAAEVSTPTIKRLEAHHGALGGRHQTGTKMRLTLERAGVEFIDENGGGPGVRLRKHQRKKS